VELCLRLKPVTDARLEHLSRLTNVQGLLV
jgi:hypothetical protein